MIRENYSFDNNSKEEYIGKSAKIWMFVLLVLNTSLSCFIMGKILFQLKKYNSYFFVY